MTEPIPPLLARAWRPEAAAISLDRWLGVREQEGWGAVPANVDLLVQVFGASWYFTRFVFYSGTRAANLVDDPLPVDDAVPVLVEVLGRAAREGGEDVESALDRLRLVRNEYMLSALVRWLDRRVEAEALEAALTRLAEAVLAVSLDLFGLTPRKLGSDFAVLGMGRLAGREMTFGSDLDLIFLLPGDGGQDSAEGARRVRRFLRHIAAAAPLGTLYEVDMRLRPHGTAGALVTSLQSFVDYHRVERETWERQMMTRCRPIFDPVGMGAAALDLVRPHVFAVRDRESLRKDIFEMRMRVERELGRRRGGFEVKRGRGGIMDVDFVCHFLQLAHGNGNAALQSCSTRAVLENAVTAGVLAPDAGAGLRRDYEFLRRLETCLRLYDLKNISSFSLEPAACAPLAYAMGYREPSGAGFRNGLAEVTGRVRGALESILAPGD